MDPITKLFIINLIWFVLIIIVDRKIFNDAIEHHKITGTIAGIWALATIISLPAYITYLMVII